MAEAGILDALARARRFLLTAQGCAACGGGTPAIWQDFDVFGAPSDEWVAAYAAAALAELDLGAEKEAAARCWRFLARESGGAAAALGYREGAARDADSTLWGCRLARLLGQESCPRYRAFAEFLRGCLRPDGGVATYPSAAALAAQFPGYGRLRQGHGWMQPHVCVTAAAAWLPEFQTPEVIAFLIRAQSREGCWHAHWWADREYATAHAVESLARLEEGAQPAPEGSREAVARGVRWLCELPPGASPFRLALRALGISAGRQRGWEPSLAELPGLQHEDGSWPASARLRVPPLDAPNPNLRWNWDEQGNGFGSIVLDRARIFTTATAVRALNQCLKR